MHIGRHPLVFIPLAMAGEAHAPVAAMIGTDQKDPHLLVVAQPRNRDQRFEFAHKLARIFMKEILQDAERRIPKRGAGKGVMQCSDAPQIWVPNRAGAEFVRMLGRSTRFRKTTGPWKVPANVPRMGKWLTFYADRTLYAGSSLLVPATAALSQHWATGQSAEEDEHLGTLLAWIEPGDGLTGVEAADRMEDPVEHPPAGPSTDPSFDNTVLAPLIQRYHETVHNSPARDHVQSQIESELHTQLIDTWHQVWRAIDLLEGLDPGDHVDQRWQDDLAALTRTADWIATSPGAQRKRDLAVEAARRLHEFERHHARYEAQRAFDDPLVMAEARMLGEAFVGIVTAARPNLRVGARKLPRIIVETTDPVRLTSDETGLCSPARPRQRAEIKDIVEVDGGLQIELELSEGMGNRREPAPGTVPSIGEEICYSLFSDNFRRTPALPRIEETPWTHGGPPTPYIPTEEDAEEEWE
ncbi:hypothetical protein [Micromonospora sp. WMMD710]|uniref:hypothetical protein n=1 Tax=Micromonospora sp. WMMD710 TaxID=3016085 RepID=UPI00241760C8|nr:hypothetical protein [Micromonospora sp. WMMD710]MDG4760320.1 hypothetical protein [Micromonospora sp. WMMD710]